MGDNEPVTIDPVFSRPIVADKKLAPYEAQSSGLLDYIGKELTDELTDNALKSKALVKLMSEDPGWMSRHQQMGAKGSLASEAVGQPPPPSGEKATPEGSLASEAVGQPP